MAKVRIGIDVGGSGVKGALVDTAKGTLASDRVRFDTPQPATPEGLAAAVASLVKELGGKGPIGIGFPAVVKEGWIHTASNIDISCIGVNAIELFSSATGREVVVINDADAAGLGEYKFGSVREATGTVVVLTFGTGIGSALLSDGRLIPNVELGQIELRGIQPAELYYSAKAMTEEGLDWADWGKRANEYVGHVARLFSPDLIVVGGGVVSKWEMFVEAFDPDLPVVPAALRKNAGIIGAASLVATASG